MKDHPKINEVWDAFDCVDIRFVHAVEKLPDIRREGFHITPLSFGVERVEGE